MCEYMYMSYFKCNIEPFYITDPFLKDIYAF